MAKELKNLCGFLQSQNIDCEMNPYGDKVYLTFPNGGSGNIIFDSDSNKYLISLNRQISYNSSSSVKYVSFQLDEETGQRIQNYLETYSTWCENTVNGTTTFTPKSEDYQQFLGRKAVIETAQEGLTVDSYKPEKGTFDIRFPDKSGFLAVTPNEDESFRASFYRSFEGSAKSETTMRFENLNDLAAVAKEYSTFCENTVPYDRVIRVSPEMTEKLYENYLGLKDQLDNSKYEIDRFQLRDNTFDINLGNKNSMRITMPIKEEEGYTIQVFQNGFRLGNGFEVGNQGDVLSCVDQFSAHCNNPEAPKEFNYQKDYSQLDSSTKSPLCLAELEDSNRIANSGDEKDISSIYNNIDDRHLGDMDV